MKPYFSVFLLVTLLNLSFGVTFFAQAPTLSQDANKIKLKVIRFDTTKTIEVKLKDKSKVKGKITEINDDHFVIDSKKVRYDEVEKIKKPTPAWHYAVAVGAIAGGIWLFACAARECGSLR